jgi:hypothetical protein
MGSCHGAAGRRRSVELLSCDGLRGDAKELSAQVDVGLRSWR